jgi:CelD/BcsL family acetyltransferase involved in cellulose biosynthesis
MTEAGRAGPPSSTRIESVSSEVEFANLAGRWDELVRAMPRPSPFLLHGWLHEWWRHYGARRSLAVYVALRGDRLVGALPLCRGGRRLGVRVTQFLGGTAAPLADLMVAAGEDPSTAAGLADRIGSTGDDFVDLYGMRGDGRLTAALPSGSLHLLERLDGPILDLSDGWEGFERTRLSHKARRDRARRRRQLEELGAVEVSIARTPEAIEAPLEDAFRLHAVRWRGRHEGSEFATPVGKAFRRAALRRLAAQDVARLVTLRLDGRPIAFSLHLLFERTVYGVAMAFDPAFARYSPGTETFLWALESAADEGAERVEFLGDAAPYQRRLADRLDPVHEGIGLPSTLRGRAAVETLVAGIRARRRIKRSGTARRLYGRVPRPARG